MEWIKIKDRLPSVDEYVLTYDIFGRSQVDRMGHLNHNNDWETRADDEGEVEYWMPLPKPPEDI
jgi:hypothetical protein